MALIYVSAWSDAEVWRRQVALHLPGEELRLVFSAPTRRSA